MMVKRRALPSANRPPPTANANLLLAALPADNYQRIAPTLEVIPLKLKHFFTDPANPFKTCISRRRVLLDADDARRWRHGGNRHHRP